MTDKEVIDLLDSDSDDSKDHAAHSMSCKSVKSEASLKVESSLKVGSSTTAKQIISIEESESDSEIKSASPTSRPGTQTLAKLPPESVNKSSSVELIDSSDDEADFRHHRQRLEEKLKSRTSPPPEKLGDTYVERTKVSKIKREEEDQIMAASKVQSEATLTKAQDNHKPNQPTALHSLKERHQGTTKRPTTQDFGVDDTSKHSENIMTPGAANKTSILWDKAVSVPNKRPAEDSPDDDSTSSMDDEGDQSMKGGTEDDPISLLDSSDDDEDDELDTYVRPAAQIFLSRFQQMTAPSPMRRSAVGRPAPVARTAPIKETAGTASKGNSMPKKALRNQDNDTKTSTRGGRMSLEKLGWEPRSQPKRGLSNSDDSGEESSDGEVEYLSTSRDHLKEITTSDDGSVASQEADGTNNAEEGSASSTAEEGRVSIRKASEASTDSRAGKCVEKATTEKHSLSVVHSVESSAFDLGSDDRDNRASTQKTAKRDTALSNALSGRRRDKSLILGSDFDSTEQQRQKYITRDRKDRRSKVGMTNNSVPTLENENEPINMYLVPHLSKEGLKDGLPFQRITVHTPSDDTVLYEFEVNVKRSKVGKNAGMGCFLTFRGARVLNSVRWKANQKKYDERVIIDPGTMEDLEARTQYGSGIAVKLTGKHLFGHNNSVFRTDTEKVLPADFQGQRVSLHLSGKNLHYESDEDEALCLSCCPKRIGLLGLNIFSDYVMDHSREFAVAGKKKRVFIDLGRYGPWRKEDRKRKVDFDTKNFLYDNEPTGWCFGIDDQYLGCDQIIDITDDGTGEPHNEAKRHTRIFVNEVGHNPTLVRNVHITHTVDGAVKYYAEIAHSMVKDEEVELLVDYKGPYEATRERKGYGKANHIGQSKSDQDLATKLVRNHVERLSIEQMIETLEPLEIFYNLEFLSERVLPILEERTHACFTSDPSTPLPTDRQLIARRRLHWMVTLYKERVLTIEKLAFQETESKRKLIASLQAKCHEWVKMMQWRVIASDLPLPSVADKHLATVMDGETLEEVLYYVQDQLEHAMDVNVWCPIARNLTLALCKAAFIQIRRRKWLCRTTLAKAFMSCAIDAAREIRDAIDANSLDALAFLSGSEGTLAVKGSTKNFVTLSAGSALSHSTAIKGAISSLVDLQAYADLAMLGGFVDFNHVEERTCDDPVVVVVDPLSKSVHSGIPRRIEFVTKSFGKINYDWYMVWQNIRLTFVMFKALVQKFPDAASTDYSPIRFLEQLCRVLKMDHGQVQTAMEQGFRKDLATPKMTFTSNAAKTTKRKNKRTPKKKGTKAVLFRISKPKAVKPKKPRAQSGARPVQVSYRLFEEIIWTTLTDLGWTKDVGTRPRDFYFLPPGVCRGNRFRNRVDYVDSVKLVLDFIQTRPDWKENEKVKKCLKLYEGCRDFLSRRKTKGALKVDWIVEQVNNGA